jgi:hypothetical protein
MRDDLLKEELMRYATDGTERASQPELAVIRRRGRRHYQRLVVLAVTGALVVAGGVGLGLGLGRAGSVPTVNQPRPPVTVPGPAVTGRVPETFVAGIDGRVAVLSTRTGRIVRTLWGPDPAAPQVYAAGASVADGRPLHAPDRGCELVNAAFQPRNGQLAAFERCQRSGAVPRFRLVYLDAASGRLRARSFAFDDHSGADLVIESTDFDRSGRWLLYAVGSHDPMDSQQPRPETGTWWHGGGRRVRVHDDLRVGSGDTSQLITSTFPAW